MDNRALDVKVAETVFGEIAKLITAPVGPALAVIETASEKLVGIVPYYSTDISAAWTVVEKMRFNGWRLVLCVVPEGYAAAFTKDVRVDGNEPYQESAARAICMAALKVIGENNGL